MSTRTIKEEGATIRGQAMFLNHLHGGLSSVALRCALKFNIAGIINNHDGPITLSQIAHGINSPSLNVDGLSRLMRFLVHKKIFDEVRHKSGSIGPLYTLNDCSKLFLHDTSSSMAPLAMVFTEPLLFSPLYNLNQSMAEGGTALLKTYGVDLWTLLSRNPEVSKTFNEAMARSTMIDIDVILSNYNFDSLKGTLVDIGGGIGTMINEIVTAYPHLNAINFDLPHVISTAPAYERVTHVGGDMFTTIPHAETFFIKSILHNWSDDKCVKILQKCRDSLTEKTGKVIIGDIVLNPEGDDILDEARNNYDMLMLACFDGGKERTEVDWKMILEEAGFCRYNIIKIPAVISLIEAYLD